MPEHKPSILVVDDEPDTCDNLRDILSELGYDVDTALDGPTALELVRNKPYDLALLDLRMPGMNGLELYRQVRKLRSGTVAIVVTAYASSDTAREVIDAGAWKIVSKPVDLSALLGLVAQALDQPLVFVVDDDHDLCDNLWELLRNHNYRVFLAHDVDEAQRGLADRAYDVVLIDMKLPKGDGGQVFRFVRETNPTAGTVIITGYRDAVDQQVHKVVAEGVDAVCYKPFEVNNLLDTIRRLTSRE